MGLSNTHRNIKCETFIQIYIYNLCISIKSLCITKVYNLRFLKFYINLGYKHWLTFFISKTSCSSKRWYDDKEY